MFTRCSFDKRENNLNYYRGKDCIENLCKKLKESTTEIINNKETEMIPLTHEENIFYNEQGVCYISKEKFCADKNDKNYINKKKVKDHCRYTGKFRGAAHSKCNFNYKVLKEIPIIIKVNLIVLGIIWKNISLFPYQLKKKLIIMIVMTVKRKQLHTNLNLLIVLDLCQLRYQNLLITHLELLIV